MSLNTSQQAAVDSTAKKILVLAGAGTGKTHTMISRISRLVNDGVDVSNILVLTFTNAAAREMNQRYMKTHPNGAAPKFCTFHAFCYSLLARDLTVRRVLGYTTVPRIPSEAELRKLETSCKKQCGTKLSDDKLKGKIKLTKTEQFQYDIYWKQYDKLLKSNGLITFDILCSSVCGLFAQECECVQSYKQRYTHLFVDEFQDTDPRQWRFVSSFVNANLFVVGDAKQAIYSFRGADSSIIKSLAENSEWETIKLSQNYRSTQQICDFANAIHKSWKDTAYDLKIVSDKQGNNVVVKSEFVMDGINSLTQLFSIFKFSNPTDTYALLCRSNSEVAQIKQLLQKANIPFTTNNQGKDIASIMKSAVDSSYMISWLADKLSASEYNNFIRLCSVDPNYETEEGFLSEYGNRVSRYSKDIFAIRSVLDSDVFAPQKCVSIKEILHLPNTQIELTSQTNEAVVDHIMKCIELATVESNVYVGTIHSVKGLEFDIVHLIGVNGKSFPVYKNEEQMNVYYVGCTRAKKELVVWNSSIGYEEEVESNDVV